MIYQKVYVNSYVYKSKHTCTCIHKTVRKEIYMTLGEWLLQTLRCWRASYHCLVKHDNMTCVECANTAYDLK